MRGTMRKNRRYRSKDEGAVTKCGWIERGCKVQTAFSTTWRTAGIERVLSKFVSRRQTGIDVETRKESTKQSSHDV